MLSRAGQDVAVFTGDMLFIGNVGRPDLRAKAGNLTARREELARQLYHSLRGQLLPLADDVLAQLGSGIGAAAVMILAALAGTWTYSALRGKLPH